MPVSVPPVVAVPPTFRNVAHHHGRSRHLRREDRHLGHSHPWRRSVHRPRKAAPTARPAAVPSPRTRRRRCRPRARRGPRRAPPRLFAPLSPPTPSCVLVSPRALVTAGLATAWARARTDRGSGYRRLRFLLLRRRAACWLLLAPLPPPEARPAPL